MVKEMQNSPGQRNALADDAALPVEGDDLLAALCDSPSSPQLGDEARHDIVFHRLVVGASARGRSPARHRNSPCGRRAGPCRALGDFFHEAFGADAALRAAETAEGRVGDVLVFSGSDFTSTCGLEIGVVDMEQRAVRDRPDRSAESRSGRRIRPSRRGMRPSSSKAQM